MDHSTHIRPYEPEIREILTTLIQPMDRRDWIDVSLVDRNSQSTGKKNANLLQTLNYIFKSPTKNDTPVHLGENLYNRISELLNVNRNKSILLFTSGKIGPKSFEIYDPDIISTYARQNAIPIYVISFSDENESLFRSLAESTFGHYYNLKDMKQIYQLFEKIKTSKPLEYLLSYQGLNLKGLKNFWVHVHLKIKYKEMIGVFDSGYFVPAVILNQKNRIDLKKEFKGKQ